MNPCMVFPIGRDNLIARITPESVAQYITDPLAFKSLLEKFAAYWQYNLDEQRHRPLVIGRELQGRWVGCSPMGQEFNNPPYMWEFDERIKNAMNSPVHSLVIWHDVGFGDDLRELGIPVEMIGPAYEVELKSMIRMILGPDAFVAFEHQKTRTALDDALDSLDGDGFAGYN